METENNEQKVKERYAAEAKAGKQLFYQSCCCTNKTTYQDINQHLGYSTDQINQVPKGSDLGLGCGNPLNFAFIKQGDIVLDLGSGGGFDCF